MIVTTDSHARPHLDNLTWLRAVAAFFVVISHCLRVTEYSYAPEDVESYFLPINIFDLGSFGVCIFFALSGCTLYLSNRESIVTTRDVISFYVKRFMRIWPAFAVSLVVYMVFIEIFRVGYTGDLDTWISRFLYDYTLVNVFQYLALIVDVTGPKYLFNASYWSLPIEFHYYLLLPFAILLMRRWMLPLLVPVLFGGLMYLVFHYSLIHVALTELFQLGYTFFGGVLIATLRMRILGRLPALLGLGLGALVVVLTGLIAIDRIAVPTDVLFLADKWNCYGLAALICVALAMFSQTPRLPVPLKTLLNEYGEISYSIYLFHLVFVGFSAIIVTRLGIYGNLPKMLFVLGFSVVGSYFFCRFTYAAIEEPSIEVGRRWAARIAAF